MSPSEVQSLPRLLPEDPATASLALDLYQRVAEAPIVSPHGHVPAALLAENAPFEEPSSLFLRADHYIHRLLHAEGVPLESIVGSGFDPRQAWQLLGDHMHILAGTASSYWIQDAFRRVFGIDEPFDSASAPQIYDRIDAVLQTPEFRPRALLERFHIDVLATTDDPLDDLAAHRELATSGAIAGRVIPTFRPDRYINADDGPIDAFSGAIERLLQTTQNRSTFAGYLHALRDRRQYFIDHGAVSLDVGVIDATTLDLTSAEAETLFTRVVRGTATQAERRAFRAHAVFQLAGMSVDDGLAMTLHAGVLRNHSPQTFDRYGPDMGHDIPIAVEFTRALKPLLDRFGLNPRLKLSLFCIDEPTYYREIAPLAGFYPSVFVGAPWWFLDSPDTLLRWRAGVTEIAGFYRTSGFIDDTRAILSIPSRHDVARRADASFLARYVRQGRLRHAEAERMIDDSVDWIPRRAFGLDRA